MAKQLNLSEFKKRSDLESTLVVIGHVALVLGPLFLASWIGVSIYWLGSWLWVGLLMNGLLNLMHECAHYHVFHKRRGSDLLGHWLLGPLFLANFDSYRERHWKHHLHLGVSGDTKDAYLVDIRGTGLARLMLKCVTLRAAFEKFQVQVEVKSVEAPPSRVWIGRTLLVQGALLGILMLVAGPIAGRTVWPWGFLTATLAYALVYLYGLASLTVYAATLRAIAEHQIEAGGISETGRAALRNFRCGPVAWLIFGAYGFAEHATHHREPAIPYYHLSWVTSKLAAVDSELQPRHRYLTEIMTLTGIRTPDKSPKAN